MSTDLSSTARALSGALEPFVGSVYFAKECHEAYAALGFAPSTRVVGDVMMPDGPAYFTSRGSLLGQVPGAVVAAAFAVFNPVAVVASVSHGWTLTSAPTIRAVRADATVAQLSRILGPNPEGVSFIRQALARAVDMCEPAGRALFAGALSGDIPTDDLAAAWHLGDVLREYRGDSHTAAWTAADLDAVEIGLMTELYWGLPPKSYVRTRAWSNEQLDAGLDRLRTRGLIIDGKLSESGKQLREQIERSTDAQMAKPLAAIGDDVDQVVIGLRRWSAAVRAARGYPTAGPMDLANAAVANAGLGNAGLGNAGLGDTTRPPRD
jgi:hypothetical protein